MTTPTGWGTTEWGRGPWGLGAEVDPAVPPAYVYASGDRTIRVTLTFEPLWQSPIGLGDARNPKTWHIEEPSTGRVFNVLAVRRISSTELELTTLQPLRTSLSELALTAPTLKAVNGSAVLNFAAPFAGQQTVSNSTDQLKTQAVGYSLRDVANPPTPNSPVGGTLQVTAGGDYQSVTGTALLRKLIMRRLISKPGDFFHLPTYGAALEEKVPMATTDLRQLAKHIETQLRLEPEVTDAAVRLTLQAASNTLVVQMTVAVAPTGEKIELGLDYPTAGLAL